jgi:hypothetical protein
VKRVVRIFIGLPKVTRHCGEVDPLRNERQDVQSTDLRKDDGGTPGQARTSGRAAIKREQREQLGSDHREKRATGKKARPIRDVTSKPSEKKWRYACRLFGTNTLKEGAMWYVDPLLSNNCEIRNYTTAVTK